MKAKPELSTILYTCISILFLLIFIPVLFCVLFLGNTMDYYENVKLITLFGNKRIAIFSILVIQGFFLLFPILCLCLYVYYFYEEVKVKNGYFCLPPILWASWVPL